MQQNGENEKYREKLREMNDRRKRFKYISWGFQMEKNKGNNS